MSLAMWSESLGGSSLMTGHIPSQHIRHHSVVPSKDGGTVPANGHL